MTQTDSTQSSTESDDNSPQIPGAEECPACHEQTLVPESGCTLCLNDGCGYSPCK